MANLILGPCLRHVGETDATVWVEADAPCEVAVLGRRARTFTVAGHHYALVVVEGLGPGGTHPYTVELDGEVAWPLPAPGPADLPPSVIRTVDPRAAFRLVFGSCRDAAPHEPPYTLSPSRDPRGLETDALRAYALRMASRPHDEWPDALLLLGDQIYADEPSPRTAAFIRARRGDTMDATDGVADFEEYTHLFRESWGEPVVRWLLSTVSTAMIFDDHDVHDDWNTSAAWVADMRTNAWWPDRIAGGLMSYWVYQHLGNLSPAALADSDLYARVLAADDATAILRAHAERADREAAGTRWSYRRDFGRVTLVVIDSRCGRVLGDELAGGRRDMLDDAEWDWLGEQVTGDFDHLLIGTTLPFLLGHGTHSLEEWNEAVCAGAWGRAAARVGEKVRQAADLEHWAAFRRSFDRLTELIRSVGAGERGSPPASIVVLSGDVHHAYLAEARYPHGSRVRSAVHQAVCSPLRNPVPPSVQRVHRFAMTRTARVLMGALARSAGRRPPAIDWEVTDGPWFNNQVATVELDGPRAVLRIERALPGAGPAGWERPRLEPVLERPLTTDVAGPAHGEGPGARPGPSAPPSTRVVPSRR